ncbi:MULTISPECIES: hypothetical protein [Streptomyces]
MPDRQLPSNGQNPGDLITAYWPDILQGKKPLSDLQTMADKINEAIKSNS